MSKMIQVRHVPERLHRRLKMRAAAAGMSLSDYLRIELERVAARLTPEEVLQRIEGLEPVAMDETAAAVLRSERDTR